MMIIGGVETTSPVTDIANQPQLVVGGDKFYKRYR
jgi:hypothetical protein